MFCSQDPVLLTQEVMLTVGVISLLHYIRFPLMSEPLTSMREKPGEEKAKPWGFSKFSPPWFLIREHRRSRAVAGFDISETRLRWFLPDKVSHAVAHKASLKHEEANRLLCSVWASPAVPSCPPCSSFPGIFALACAVCFGSNWNEADLMKLTVKSVWWSFSSRMSRISASNSNHCARSRTNWRS